MDDFISYKSNSANYAIELNSPYLNEERVFLRFTTAFRTLAEEETMTHNNLWGISVRKMLQFWPET